MDGMKKLSQIWLSLQSIQLVYQNYVEDQYFGRQWAKLKCNTMITDWVKTWLKLEVEMSYFMNKNPSHHAYVWIQREETSWSLNFSTNHHTSQSMFKSEQLCELWGRRHGLSQGIASKDREKYQNMLLKKKKKKRVKEQVIKDTWTRRN